VVIHTWRTTRQNRRKREEDAFSYINEKGAAVRVRHSEIHLHIGLHHVTARYTYLEPKNEKKATSPEAKK
jgi:hypothetical protein